LQARAGEVPDSYYILAAQAVRADQALSTTKYHPCNAFEIWPFSFAASIYTWNLKKPDCGQSLIGFGAIFQEALQ